MNKTSNSKLTGISKVLRKNMTPEENRLWYDFLKKLPQTVHRQKVIGKYVVDFYCASAKIVIELDGSQHREEKGAIGDYERDAYLKANGITVLRYSNLDVNKRFNDVCRDIMMQIEYRSNLENTQKSIGNDKPDPFS